MDKLDELLKHIQKTNPEMTKEKMTKEISKSFYVLIPLLVIFDDKNSFEE